MFTYRCRVLRVVDGDTLNVDIDLGFGVHKIVRVRLAGVDTPERGDPTWVEATAFTQRWVAAHTREGFTIVTAKPSPRDKYGRYLAELGAAESSGTLNEALLTSGLARRYPPEPA